MMAVQQHKKRLNLKEDETKGPYNKFALGFASFLIISAAVIYSFWQQELEGELEQFSRVIDYHLESHKYLEDMIDETLIIQGKLASIEDNTPSLIIDNDKIQRDIYSDLGNFNYYISDTLESLKKLQDQFRQKLFSGSLARLDFNANYLSITIAQALETEKIPTEELLLKLSDLKITAKQFALLHIATKEFLIVDMKTKRAAQRNRFLIILGGILILGIFSTFFIFHRINSLYNAQKHAQKETYLALEALQKADLAKSEFLSHMSHDLRTPLNSILGFSQIMEEKIYGPLGSPQYDEYIKLIYSSGENLLNLINDILDLSRLESGEYSMQKSKLDMLELAQDSFQRCTSTPMGEMEDRFLIEISRNAPLLYSDQRAISQILDNLVTNAIKYAGPNSKISVKWFVNSDERGVLEVSDNGRGIPAKYLANILKPYVRGGTIDVSKIYVSKTGEGVGLGLHIISKLADILGAELVFKSKENKGTSVSFFFDKEFLVYNHNTGSITQLHANGR